MPNIHIILLHAAAAGIYLRDFDRISPSVYGGRRTQRKRMLTLLTSIVIIRKKTYQNETKIANTRDSYDRSSVTELRRREKKNNTRNNTTTDVRSTTAAGQCNIKTISKT